jgi:DNA processing protein
VGLEAYKLKGEHFELAPTDSGFPEALLNLEEPPERLYGIGNPAVLREGLAIVGARKATPYGKSLARHFSALAAEKEVVVVSGGARGCDSCAHEAALSVNGPTVVFLGGGCHQLYPSENIPLFQRVVAQGGAVVSEHPWEFPPMPHTFRARNRLIAGLARATLIVEAGLPSGTFSTADEALRAGREVWVVPGAITSRWSKGSNRLLHQGATPIVDDESFTDALFSTFGCLKQEEVRATSRTDKTSEEKEDSPETKLLAALQAEPLAMDQLQTLAQDLFGEQEALTRLMLLLASCQRSGLIAQYPDGRYGPNL